MGLATGAPARRHRTARVTTGAVPAGGSVTVEVALKNLPSDVFTVAATVEHGTAGNTLEVRKVTARTAGSVSVLVGNNDALNAHTGVLHVLAAVQ